MKKQLREMEEKQEDIKIEERRVIEEIEEVAPTKPPAVIDRSPMSVPMIFDRWMITTTR